MSNQSDNSWTLVSKPKKKYRKKCNDNPEQKDSPDISSFSNTPNGLVNLELPSIFYDDLDGLSILVLHVLLKCDNPLPASAIKKEVNLMIAQKQIPNEMTKDKEATLKFAGYAKKDIGWVLYDGPLSKYLCCNQNQVPRLWNLNYSLLHSIAY